MTTYYNLYNRTTAMKQLLNASLPLLHKPIETFRKWRDKHELVMRNCAKPSKMVFPRLTTKLYLPSNKYNTHDVFFYCKVTFSWHRKINKTFFSFPFFYFKCMYGPYSAFALFGYLFAFRLLSFSLLQISIVKNI